MNVALPRRNQADIKAPEGRTTRIDAVRPEIATLMATMLRLIDQHGSVVVYFTAVSPGEGTTTIVRELASAAARLSWCKVALIDANHVIGGTGSLDVTAGLLDEAGDSGDLPMRRIWLGGAELVEGTLIGTGRSVPRVEVVRALFDRLRKRYSLVIVDSPPISPTHQAAAFSAAADCVVIVVEAERTRANDLERARATLEQLGARILGVVLNKRRHWIPGFLSRLF